MALSLTSACQRVQREQAQLDWVEPETGAHEHTIMICNYATGTDDPLLPLQFLGKPGTLL